MGKIALAIILKIFLVAAIAGVLFVNLAAANPSPPVSYPENPDTNEPTIVIEEPVNEKISNVNYVTLSFSVQKPLSWFNIYPIHGDLKLISYILDGKKVDLTSSLDNEHANSKPLTFTKVISELSQGNHSLQVYVRSVSYYLDPNRPSNDSGYGWWDYPPANYYVDTHSSMINFTIDTISPVISNLSIENVTYKLTEVPLVLNVNEVSKISYSLDNEANITINGNTTLTDLSYGEHNVTVYVWDIAGNIGKSETINFTIAKEIEPQLDSFPVVLVTASVAFVAILGVGLLVYFKKRTISKFRSEKTEIRRVILSPLLMLLPALEKLVPSNPQS